MSKVAWVVQDGDGAVVVLAHSERGGGAVERYLVEFLGVRTEDLYEQMTGWPENEESMSFGVEAVLAEKAMKQFGQGPVRLSQLLDVDCDYDWECPVCGAPVTPQQGDHSRRSGLRGPGRRHRYAPGAGPVQGPPGG